MTKLVNTVQQDGNRQTDNSYTQCTVHTHQGQGGIWVLQCGSKSFLQASILAIKMTDPTPLGFMPINPLVRDALQNKPLGDNPW